MTKKQLGQASTTAEKNLEAVLAEISMWDGKELSYESVSGGISNANWRIVVPGETRSFFLKIPGDGTENFINRVAANNASNRAYEAGIGVEVIHFDVDSGVAVFEFIDGLRTSTNGDFLNHTVRTNAVRSLRAFNDAAGLELQKTLMDMIDEHVGQVLKFGGHFPQDFGWLNRKYLEARTALEASGLDIVPCMNDTLASNFLLDDDNNITLVDFEYASNNDRCAELAVWFGEMFFDPATEREVIEEYFGKVDESIMARITVYKALADFKWSTWAMVQHCISALDFDYFKYGVWKHLRARSVMRHSKWEQWLKTV